MLAEDIRKRIEADFGNEAGKQVEADIESFIDSYHGVYGTHPADRIVRCIVHLAKGNSEALRHNMKAALGDWRDVIYWAEYDSKDKRIFDFSLPFKLSE